MKKIVIIILSILFLYACKVQQELYLIIDTRDTVNIKYAPYYHDNNDDYINNFTAKYFIYKDDPGKWYGGAILLDYYPYTDSVLKKWKNINKLRTKNISKHAWRKLKRQKKVRIEKGLEWVETTPWDTIYEQLHKYCSKGALYLVDQKFATKDSIQVRGVDYIDNRAQVCGE